MDVDCLLNRVAWRRGFSPARAGLCEQVCGDEHDEQAGDGRGDRRSEGGRAVWFSVIQ